jgi:hypothetical protein
VGAPLRAYLAAGVADVVDRKIILLGEHAVVCGYLAVAAA